ncbi:MAG: chemotaxis protein CheD [Syntrophomonadales bacterium]|jgi:chemotaxis protein CheD
MSNLLQVGMADLKVARTPDKLMTAGLGSCIGICLFDRVAKVGGMAHIMLPSSKQSRSSQNRAKFADTAIEDLIDEMEKVGASPKRLTAKIAGGAQMFNIGNSEIMRIGERNARAVIEVLGQKNVRILAQDTGGNFGRTIIFDSDSGELLIRTIGQGERII